MTPPSGGVVCFCRLSGQRDQRSVWRVLIPALHVAAVRRSISVKVSESRRVLCPRQRLCLEFNYCRITSLKQIHDQTKAEKDPLTISFKSLMENSVVWLGLSLQANMYLIRCSLPSSL